MSSITRKRQSDYWEFSPASTTVEEDLSEIADYLRGLTGDGTLPLAQEFFYEGQLSCWECGNSLDADCVQSQEIEYGGLPLRVPFCSVCAPADETEAAAEEAAL